MFELTDMCGYYGDVYPFVANYTYQWELDIYNEKHQLLPYKTKSVRAIMLSDNLEDFNEDGSCKDAELEARMKLCEYHAERKKNTPYRGRINEWVKQLKATKEQAKKKSEAVQLTFYF